MQSWVFLAMKTTCYLYVLLTVKAAKLFSLWLGFHQQASKQLQILANQTIKKGLIVLVLLLQHFQVEILIVIYFHFECLLM